MTQGSSEDIDRLFIVGQRDSAGRDRTLERIAHTAGMIEVLALMHSAIRAHTSWPVALDWFDDADETRLPEFEVQIDVGMDAAKFASEDDWHDAREDSAHPIIDAGAEKAKEIAQDIVSQSGLSKAILVDIYY